MNKNLILVSFDSVRADVAYSGKFKTIEKLRRLGVTFLNTISSSPITPTSHATVLTGLQPYNHGIKHLFREQLNPNVKTLAQILSEVGYKTAAIVSCPGMNSWYDFSRGFDLYDDEVPTLLDGSDPLKTVDVKKRGTALKRADVVIEKANRWLDENDDTPFFLFMHFFDAHWPYEAPHKFGGNNAYEEEVAYSDYHLGLLIERLEKEMILDNSTLICFSDHGEDLEGLYPNDKGGPLLGHPEEFGHGCLLYDQTQKVLLIMSDQELPRCKNVEQQVRLVDVVPTILDILKVKHEPDEFDGRSLMPIIRNGENLQLPGYSETFYPEEQAQPSSDGFSEVENKMAFRIDNKYKIIVHLNSRHYELYNLEADPNELHDLNKISNSLSCEVKTPHTEGYDS